MKSDVVNVSAPARLHLGFLDMNGSLGRMFGGIGMAISAPVTRLTLSRASTTTVDGPDRTRARWHLEAIRSHLSISYEHHHLVIHEVIPSHSGLGSGTQIALAVAAAVRALEGLPLDPEGDAQFLGRGNRSGVGAGFFLKGGVLVDGGKGHSASPPPVIARLPFPEDWRVIMVLDPALKGLTGNAEVDAFSTLPPFPERDAADICRLVLMQVLPALAETDIAAFGAAISDIQRRVGQHFGPAQGGPFASRQVGDAIAMLGTLGAHGLGQSSWGPTGFAFAPGAEEAAVLVRQLKESGNTEGLDIRIVEGRNDGATIEIPAP
ncbi:beta-ribofuranosylaminobenzene 5'-phosphate synthase [Aureimonas sp. SA4125]|uniref:beta-ribofuranosylaminobenzene 5'-phosphate synthase family protein n=1 Tax=Aureimonas sp. SA4125 TaxID=2826993 RepID=UPI001CC7946D|nr:beta-ribofuranosylaminobenzene 5'-phosphate synthase family protein [Aureimonas sp. SA4125]BDA86308.1 beta-ribofuranosylaminobenzene 5'-phosphate synthase [Aureimonas sp. SA4125]